MKALILSQHDELVATQQRLLSRESEIEHLKLLLAKLRRMQFGRKSEKLERQIEQLELKLEELESAKDSPRSEFVPAFSAQPSRLTAPAKPARQPLPDSSRTTAIRK
jgi:predicted RecB family endonuclease